MRNFLTIFFVATFSTLANASEKQFLTCVDIPYNIKKVGYQKTIQGGWRAAWPIEYHSSFIFGDSIKRLGGPSFPYDPTQNQKVVSTEDIKKVLLGISHSVPDLIGSNSYVHLFFNSKPFFSRNMDTGTKYHLYIDEKLLTDESDQGLVIEVGGTAYWDQAVVPAICSRVSQN